MNDVQQLTETIAARSLAEWQELNAIDMLADLGLLFANMMLPHLEWREMAELGRTMRRLASYAGGGDD